MKCLLFFVVMVCLFGCKPHEKNIPVVTAERSYTSIHSFWDSLPSPRGYLNDFEHIYTNKQQRFLDSLLTDFEAKSSVEISLVTIDTSATPLQRFDELAKHIADTWGVGQKGKNNGIVVMISAGYHRMRISNGSGIEKMLTDAETQKIIDEYFIPGFKKEDYFTGTTEGLSALMKKTATAAH